MSNNNGIISPPVNPQEVYSVLGVAKVGDYWDIGYICSNNHGKINQWSEKKPVRLNTPKELTDADFFDVNDGFTIPSYTSASALFDAATNGSYKWTYNPPTDSEFYRLLDFNGYNHHSIPWFNMERTGGSGNPTMGSSVNFNIQKDLTWIINNFAKFRGYAAVTSGGALDLGFLIKDAAAPNNVIYYKMCDIRDIDDGTKLHLTIPASSPYIASGHTYKIVPCLTTDTNHAVNSLFIPDKEDTSKIWYSLPAPIYTLTIQSAGTSALSDLDASLFTFSFNTLSGGLYIELYSIVIHISNSRQTAINNVEVTAVMTDAINVPPQLASFYGSIPPEGIDIELVEAGKDDNAVIYESIDGVPRVTVTINVMSASKDEHFTLE